MSKELLSDLAFNTMRLEQHTFPDRKTFRTIFPRPISHIL